LEIEITPKFKQMKNLNSKFEEEYKNLNTAQKEAVEALDGPIMVVAGPGTGKTQILSLRIGNILNKTDTPPDGILCLTFTNSGVSAMRERLRDYLGVTGAKVNVFTFHSFGMKVIEEFFSVLDLDSVPILLDDTDSIALSDEILSENDWQYIKPRSDTGRYFKDLKSLISLLKKERMAPEDFQEEIKKDIKNLEESDNSIAQRGENKGQLKKEVMKKIESLERTKEVVHFYELYEKIKKERNLIDYDDVLDLLLRIVEESIEAADSIRERYLYVLVDEHQDSNRSQNEFLQKVWGKVEKPNIFVVGDDRQLIYGFSGASLSYFEEFKHTFGKAKLITLIDNYRSTQIILNLAHTLLESKMTKEKLVSHSKETHPIRLVEGDYERDEIIACALDLKEKIKKGVEINDCAVLVPKNIQARSAALILHDMGLPVASHNTLRLFDEPEAESILRVLKIIANPYDNVSLAESFFDKISGIDPISAHKFTFENNMEKFSLINFLKDGKQNLFGNDNPVESWLLQIGNWIKKTQDLKLYSLIQLVGDELLLNSAESHEELITRVEIIRTILHLVLMQVEKNLKFNLRDFVRFMERLEKYDENITLAVFGSEEGVKVLTLHSSKGLEFDSVWIAHMNERSLVGGRRQNFTLPAKVEERIEKRDEEVLKRQLYVAITRAKRFCTLSYALHSYSGSDQELAHIVNDLPENIFERQSVSETEKMILGHDPKAYVEKKNIPAKHFGLEELKKLVAQEYENRNISVSLLNNFFECPWKWYFRNLLKLPEPKSESLEFGNAVHSAIDKILKLPKKPTEKEIAEITAGDKGVLKIVSGWVKNRLPDINPERENEKSITVRGTQFPHLNIYGKIDLIEELGAGQVRVTDFKTGSVKKKLDIEKKDNEGRMSNYLRQLAMYSYLLEESSKNRTRVKESRLEFLEAKDDKEAFYDRIINEAELGMLRKDIEDYDRLVKNGEWTERPCNYNSYGKNTECEYCRRAEIYVSR
jgi:DNA helicase II / ATP-dependent DNA helicase PcrA